jgi:hypothetical protein
MSFSDFKEKILAIMAPCLEDPWMPSKEKKQQALADLERLYQNHYGEHYCDTDETAKKRFAEKIFVGYYIGNSRVHQSFRYPLLCLWDMKFSDLVHFPTNPDIQGVCQEITKLLDGYDNGTYNEDAMGPGKALIEAKLHSLRANCFKKMGDFDAALHDCAKGLESLRAVDVESSDLDFHYWYIKLTLQVINAVCRFSGPMLPGNGFDKEDVWRTLECLEKAIPLERYNFPEEVLKLINEFECAMDARRDERGRPGEYTSLAPPRGPIPRQNAVPGQRDCQSFVGHRMNELSNEEGRFRSVSSPPAGLQCNDVEPMVLHSPPAESERAPPMDNIVDPMVIGALRTLGIPSHQGLSRQLLRQAYMTEIRKSDLMRHVDLPPAQKDIMANRTRNVRDAYNFLIRFFGYE